ncbi:MAG: hypothetical protein HC811_13435 [Flammeovirgaceae bacterium]|nr:hypothetical protein [Flammeovirgaceae bacterium]
MEKFMYLFRGQDDRMSTQTQAQTDEHMQKWGAWMGDLAARGKFVAGEPLHKEGMQVNGSGKTVTDGPFVEAKEVVGGYLIVNAKDIHEAVEISKGCPIFEHNGKVEVRQIQKMEL